MPNGCLLPQGAYARHNTGAFWNDRYKLQLHKTAITRLQYRFLVLQMVENTVIIRSFFMAKNSTFCTINHHDICSGGLTSWTAFFGVMVKPSISQRNCWLVIARTSASFLGHTNFPCSRRLYKRRKPSFSQTRPLMRSALRPQKR